MDKKGSKSWAGCGKMNNLPVRDYRSGFKTAIILSRVNDAHMLFMVFSLFSGILFAAVCGEVNNESHVESN